MVECKYRGRVIGWLVTGADGFIRYKSDSAFQGGCYILCYGQRAYWEAV